MQARVKVGASDGEALHARAGDVVQAVEVDGDGGAVQAGKADGYVNVEDLVE